MQERFTRLRRATSVPDKVRLLSESIVTNRLLIYAAIAPIPMTLENFQSLTREAGEGFFDFPLRPQTVKMAVDTLENLGILNKSDEGYTITPEAKKEVIAIDIRRKARHTRILNRMMKDSLLNPTVDPDDPRYKVRLKQLDEDIEKYIKFQTPDPNS